MLEFLIFLTSDEKEIINLIQKAQFSIEENTPICLLGEKFFGFLKKRQKTVVICTQNAKNVTGYSIPRNIDEDEGMTGFYIRRALSHEAVHVAQHCNKGRTLKLTEPNKMAINPYKATALKRSTMISGNREKEVEAYWMEDKPKLVIEALKKFCF